eukprot:363316-Chlamydomonas_euryale.AAC.17
MTSHSHMVGWCAIVALVARATVAALCMALCGARQWATTKGKCLLVRKTQPWSLQPSWRLSSRTHARANLQTHDWVAELPNMVMQLRSCIRADSYRAAMLY